MREALKLALEALESGDGWRQSDAIVAIKQALAAPVQEPVAWAVHYNGPIPLFTKTKAEAEAWGGNYILPLYATPPAQPATVQPVAAVRTWHKNGDQHAELEDWGIGLELLADGTHSLYATPPAAQPAPLQEPAAYWIPKAEQFCIADPSGRPFAKAWEPLYTTPPAAQPAVPDAINDNSESPEYRSGWNDCRALMLEMRKP